MSEQFDVVVIGAGPGGYVCAIRAAQLGMRVALIEKRGADERRGPQLGGTCLNVGCIPSKALLDSSEHYHRAAHDFAEHGIDVGKLRLQLDQMMKRKDRVVRELTGGVAQLMKKHKVTVIGGTARLRDSRRIVVEGNDGEQDLQAEHVVLAMGSRPATLKGIELDGERVVSSDQAIAFDRVPKRLAVIGAGVIGLELGSVWARLGSEVTVLEYLDRIVPGYDADVAQALQRSLEKLGLQFQLGSKVQGCKLNKTAITVQAESSEGERFDSKADRVLVAVGRRPCTEDCGLEEAGVELDDSGRIRIDDQWLTSAEEVYAIGDLVQGPMLAHKAEEEGMAVAEILTGERAALDHDLIPGVVYTHPELAAVGIGEDRAKQEGRAIRVGQFRFAANGRARAAGDSDGFVKVVTDSKSDRLLGASILGPRASDMITEVATALEFGASGEDLARICHPHPTFSEAIKEAALDGQGRVLHS